MNLLSSLESIKGVGEKTAQQFKLAGITNVRDLITFLPRTYEDYTNVVKIDSLKPGKIVIKARCEKTATRTVRRGLKVTTATLVDDTGKIQATWFNRPYREHQLRSGGEFFFSGEFSFQYNRYQLSNPRVEKASDMPVHTDRLLPIYRAVKGLKTQLVRNVLHEIKPLVVKMPETLPQSTLQHNNLPSRAQALMGVHFPETVKDTERARERLAFEELFQLLLASQLNRQENTKLNGWHIPFSKDVVASFVKELPFELTGAQRRAAWEIIQDFERKTPMNRMLQGDVGSGKTVVAGLAARQAAHSGFQTAVLAPTEILASQHAATLDTLLRPFGVSVALLTGSVKGAVRKTLLKNVQNGTVNVVVGTHALLQETVIFKQLGFVVIDEQHRFGVDQRQYLLQKSAHMPHLLAMTATPIPRSLALTVYGELDISILNERPKNRKEINTKLWSPNNKEKLYEKIDAELSVGRQAYVVCSLIDENPDNDKKSVTAEYEKLRKTVFRHRRIGLLHGKLKADEKNSVMEQFAQGELDILVTTTVVEVGVDVPNATVMMIENADHFGLSQLHQLRGRVGRSTHQSYCYLVLTDSNKPSERLKEIEKSSDGFYLAEVDLKARGPGEIYGKSQHGALNLQIATLADTKLIKLAQDEARKFVESGQDLLQYKELANEVQKYQRLTTLN